MNLLVPDSWLRDFLKTEATPKEIQSALSLCSASVDRLRKTNGDFVYDIEVTTNRVDQMSVVGIAREAAAVLPHFGHSAKLIKNLLLTRSHLVTQDNVGYLTAQVDPKLCLRFTAVLIRNVTVKPSPDWMVKRLESAGMRALNNVINISNYLMHELGQPVHTFDYDKIAGHKMILRESKKGEKLTTLDGKTHTLPGGDIVIEDGRGSLIDLCGIMGGLNSAVDENTKNILLFVQTYEPNHIRRTSMSLAHRTAAAVLFEKGLPVENVLPTLEEGIILFRKLTGGPAESKILDILSAQPIQTSVKLSQNLADFVNTRLGIKLSAKEIKGVLESLDFKVVTEKEVVIPFYRRLDITIPEDLVEEVARIYGYHNLPSQLMTGNLPTNRPDDKTFLWESKIKSALKYWGFTETYSYSLISQDLASQEDLSQGKILKLRNPLTEEWEYLRTSLTPSHLKVVSENLGRVKELNLFEISNVYTPRKRELPEEQLHLILTSTKPNSSFLKGITEALSQELGTPLPTIINSHPNPTCLTLEISLSEFIPKAKTTKTYTPISKFSPIIEDINVNLAPSQTYANLTEKIKKVSSLIIKIELVDKYGDKLTLRLTYHSDTRQLSSEDIGPIRHKLKSFS